jgi:uncharacterized delta-60 repeat protein
VKKLIPALLAGTLVSGLSMGLGTGTAHAAAAGSLDPTFGKGGIVLQNLGLNSAGAQINAAVSDAALLSNGDIVVAGNFGLARFLPDGRLDTAFGTGGVAALPPLGVGGTTSALAVQPNGDYVWAGEATAPNGTNGEFAAVRYTPGGSVDTAFGTGGVAATELPGSSVQGAESVLVEPGGQILLGGEALLNQRGAPAVGALARFNSNGTVDTAFGAGGQVETSTGSRVGPVTALGLDADGNIFVLPAHAEFSPAGRLDSAVTPAAVTSSSVGGNAMFLPSGQYVTGTTTAVAKHDNDVQVKQFNSDGTLGAASPAFNYSGAPAPDTASDGASAVAVQPNGQILVGGSHFLGTAVFGLARVGAGGGLDSTFGSHGTLLTKLQGDDSIAALLVQPDGKILAVGSSEDNSTGITDVAIVRYLGS